MSMYVYSVEESVSNAVSLLTCGLVSFAGIDMGDYS